MTALLVLAGALHAGDHIAIATEDSRPARAVVRAVGTGQHSHKLTLADPTRPGRTFPVWYADTELVMRLHQAAWAA